MYMFSLIYICLGFRWKCVLHKATMQYRRFKVLISRKEEDLWLFNISVNVDRP